jgi:acetolactate synthase regulatory subunit
MFRFTITAEIADDTLLRMLNYFAQRGLRPSRVHAEQFSDIIIINIEQHDIASM